MTLFWLAFIILVSIPADKLSNHFVLLFLLKLRRKTKEPRARQEASRMLRIAIKKKHDLSVGYFIYCIFTLPFSVILIPLAISGGYLLNSAEEIDGN